MRRRLDAELVRRSLARSRTHATELIEAGRVTVAGAPASAAARMVGAEEAVHVEAQDDEFVSRGGRKLACGLDAFGVDATGLRVLDAGASTGGFTDCALQRGAREVVAVDVGHGQLAWNLRQDPRVDVHERTNVRAITVESIGGPVDLVVADLSFISLRTVAPALMGVARPGADFVLLVKPQFEAGRSRVGKGGVIRDQQVRRAVMGEVVAGLDALGLGVRDLVVSPITGADGNVEFLVLARIGDATAGDDLLDRVVGHIDGTPTVGQTGA